MRSLVHLAHYRHCSYHTFVGASISFAVVVVLLANVVAVMAAADVVVVAHLAAY